MAKSENAPDKVESLYNGDVKIYFYEKSHRYMLMQCGKTPIKPQRLTGTTTYTGILDKSRILMLWAEKLSRNYLIDILEDERMVTRENIEHATSLHRQKKEEAGSIGTQIHDWASRWIKAKIQGKKTPDPLADGDGRVFNGCLAFLKWVKEEEVKFIFTERIVYSKKLKVVVGMCDVAFTLKKEKHKVIHIGDFKTSKGVYPEMWLQVGGYEGMLTEETGKKYGDKYIMRFDKETSEFEVHVRSKEHQQSDYEIFKSIVKVKEGLKTLN